MKNNALKVLSKVMIIVIVAIMMFMVLLGVFTVRLYNKYQDDYNNIVNELIDIDEDAVRIDNVPTEIISLLEDFKLTKDMVEHSEINGFTSNNQSYTYSVDTTLDKNNEDFISIQLTTKDSERNKSFTLNLHMQNLNESRLFCDTRYLKDTWLDSDGDYHICYVRNSYIDDRIALLRCNTITVDYPTESFVTVWTYTINESGIISASVKMRSTEGTEELQTNRITTWSTITSNTQ